ncbi:hypothetical protein ABW19_dt0200214 [Dactylella cylindrospora]|nr:hypothetical protein ABW19_dt0200214 [Dactylella cylindrospora]
MATPSFALLGATGLVGSHILKFLLQSPTPSKIYTLTRRELNETPGEHTINSTVDKDTDKWPALFHEGCESSGQPPITYTALATTRGAAGGFEKQYALEHDVNVAIAKAAKDAGVKTFVLISSGGADKSSMAGYTKMKGEIEEDIEACGFEKYIILRPGLLLGDRGETRLAEGLLRSVASGLGKLNKALSESWAVPAEVVAKAAVRASLDESITGKKILYHKDIWELGRKEGW